MPFRQEPSWEYQGTQAKAQARTSISELGKVGRVSIPIFSWIILTVTSHSYRIRWHTSDSGQSPTKSDVKFPQIVAAQALLETGYFTSRVCLENNNLFGLRRPSNGSYYTFNSWEESVKAYKDYVQYKYKGGNYYEFLNRIRYAEDGSYISKVMSLERSL